MRERGHMPGTEPGHPEGFGDPAFKREIIAEARRIVMGKSPRPDIECLAGMQPGRDAFSQLPVCSDADDKQAPPRFGGQ